jgi:glycosyltransferase involved in cell wall biosynthesis
MQAEANVRVLWCHDTEALGLTYGLSLLADKVFALSQWHKGNLVEKHNLPESQVYVTRNGVNPEMWRSRIANARNAHRAIYCSSPDRGLSALLDMWPAIRRQVTDAELAIFYSWANWQRQADERGNEIHRGFIASMVNRIAELKDSGVRIEGLVSKAKLAHEMRTSGVFAYPAWFSETSCCNVMEARAAGMRIVTTPVAALKETALGEVLVEGDWTSESFRSRFAEKVVGAMLDESVDDRAARSRKAVEELDWARVAEDWERLFGELLAGAERGAMPAFKEAV